MVDLEVATAVTPVAGPTGRSTVTLTDDWEVWGPMGGYVAAIALRAAGAQSRFARPASFYCQYLGVAAFAAVDLEVTTLRSGRNAEALRVSMTQTAPDGRVRAILEALVWAVGDVPPEARLEHDAATPPDVDGPEGLPSIEELVDDPDEGPPFRFWDNVDARPLSWSPTWPPAGPQPAQWQEWLRLRPTATFADPWVDAARTVMFLDLAGWPSASRPHAYLASTVIAPNLDLAVAFHQPEPTEEWLLVDAQSPTARDGLMGYSGRLWSPSRRLVASASGQLLCRDAGPLPG